MQKKYYIHILVKYILNGCCTKIEKNVSIILFFHSRRWTNYIGRVYTYGANGYKRV